MATYKIPQDVEAEDKLLGPFTFKQFVFLIIAAVGIGVAYLLFKLHPALIAIPLPVIIICLILGLYRRPDQPVETYLLAALNFNLKPRKRGWDPEGWHENVHLIAPKKMALPAEKGSLSQVHGQLEQLARVVDSRGWVAKDPELSVGVGNLTIEDGDRLISMNEQMSRKSEPLDVHASDDILDPYNNPDAQDLGKLAQTSTSKVKADAIAKMNAAKTRPSPIDTSTPSGSSAKFQPYPQMQQKVVSPRT